MGFLQRLLGSEDDGCGNHHFDIINEKDYVRVRPSRGDPCKLVVERKVLERCLHEGCIEKRQRWIQTDTTMIQKDNTIETVIDADIDIQEDDA